MSLHGLICIDFSHRLFYRKKKDKKGKVKDVVEMIPVEEVRDPVKEAELLLIQRWSHLLCFNFILPFKTLIFLFTAFFFILRPC